MESRCFEELPGILALAIPSVEEALLPVMEIVPIQLLAASRAMGRGIPVGVFERGNKVTTSE